MQSSSPADSLRDEQKAASQLLQLLQREQACLVSANIEELTGLTEEKAKAVAQMTELAMRRHKLLGAAGFEAAESGMQAWLKTPAATPAASQLWNDLLGLAQAAKTVNRTNGILIGQHLARNQAALNILQGNPQGAGFYGPDGQATAQAARRSLVVG